MAANMKRKDCGAVKTVLKPVISTDVMGNRNVEVKPVGAWVQPYFELGSDEVPDAIVCFLSTESM